jgi:hypothetical protein
VTTSPCWWQTTTVSSAARRSRFCLLKEAFTAHEFLSPKDLAHAQCTGLLLGRAVSIHSLLHAAEQYTPNMQLPTYKACLAHCCHAACVCAVHRPAQARQCWQLLLLLLRCQHFCW